MTKIDLPAVRPGDLEDARGVGDDRDVAAR